MNDGGDSRDAGPESLAGAAQTVSAPDPETAAALVTDALADGALVTVFGECTVSYEGRAASERGPGARLVVLKPDGSALVHADSGQRPVNWQPPGSELTARDEGAALVVEGRRSTPEERLLVRFSEVVHAAAYAVASPASDAGSPSVVGTEADLKARILENPALVEPGFTPLATERETPAGAVDVYGTDETGRAVVLELKRRRVGPDAVGQLARYVEALQRDLHADAEVRGVLVAPSVTERASALLADRGLEFVPLSPTGE